MDEKRKKESANEGLVWRLHSTFQVEWDPRPWYLGPRAAVEDIFSGGDGFGKGYWERYHEHERQLEEEQRNRSHNNHHRTLKEPEARENFQTWLLDMS
ncbi:hypothetical protein AWJ20_1221 [Sugiyamaella lignohabitans]|uniref:Uncharacterized protein n=1 Tax=Sugiyamaella lignohabitans TaxID=796027 RepID=A0A167DI48_9ASCO|nr:uncharacterized protein AWJ20_1221 [Sugiyamaella lignohabitans]ANB12943.1 hypothetical protein AWJ20_1221 [Sugiyamaella lignohabitans]